MSTSTENDERLAELIWRTVKLRVSLLILTNLVLLVTWSSVDNGKKQAQAVDLDFCKQLVAQSNKWLPSGNVDPAIWCRPEGARNYVEAARMSNGILLSGWQALSNDTSDAIDKERLDKLFKQYSENKQILDEYDVKRREAFPLQVQLASEYSGGNIVLNGRFVAKVLPFCALVIFSIVVVLGYQQTCYKRQLTNLLRAVYVSTNDRAGRIARGQFFAAFSSNRDSRFHDWTVIAPDRLAIAGLYMLFAVAFFSVVLLVISDIIDLTNSVLFNYPSGLLVAAFVLAILLRRTRERYDELFPPSSTPRTTRSRWAFVAFHWKELALSGVGLFSLFFQWTRGAAVLRGYNFIIGAKRTPQPGGLIFTQIEPSIFRELSSQVIFAVLFLLVCAVHGILSIHRSQTTSSWLGKAQYLMSAVVLFLSLNYLIYMGILQYGTSFAANPWPSLVATVLGGSHEIGAPMVFFDPTYSFWVFVSCCVLLVWVTVRDRHLVH
jgi:hypothetical protein